MHCRTLAPWNRNQSVRMPNDPVYKNSGFYRGSAPVALLCEGDVIGYEAQLLGRWFRSQAAGALKIDVWACGTGHGLRAIADSFGREVKIVGIEDRDFRTESQSEQDCVECFNDLDSRRGVAVRGWFTWGRNEVENYFLDDEILTPVMIGWFGCTHDDVKEALRTAVGSLAAFQAVQAAVYGVRRWWENTDPAVGVADSASLYVGGRPSWKDGKLAPADSAAIKQKLLETFDKWRDRHAGDKAKTHVPEKADIAKVFDQWAAGTPDQTLGADRWRADWAGKEILKLVRQQLAHRFGTNYGANLGKLLSQQRIEPKQSIPWHKWNRKTCDSIDRELEHEMQSHLVKQLIEFATDNAQSAIRADLHKIGAALKS